MQQLIVKFIALSYR